MQKTISEQKRTLEQYIKFYNGLIRQCDRMISSSWRKHDKKVDQGDPEAAKELIKLMKRIRRLRRKHMAAIEGHETELKTLVTQLTSD